MFAEFMDIYRQSLKPTDSLFNRFLARPLATPLVSVFLRLKWTPNQVSMFGLVPLLAGAVSWTIWPDGAGLWAGLLLVELAYVIDCADGQLARMTHQTSELGAALDFMLDEMKAFFVIAALGARWAMMDNGGLVAWQTTVAILVVLAVAFALTRFRRSDVYAHAMGVERIAHGTSAGEAARRASPLWPLKMVARLITQYPVGLPLFVYCDRIDAFLGAYGLLHLMYIGQASFGMVRDARRSTDHDQHSDGDSSH
ncbi:MAG: CDP-alcohol phosphatidyltransferase family protein [Myxococcota bacterium]|nr:CDP-alcohol phosphatidyltransferase family protein [Myxococcota bacterium]